MTRTFTLHFAPYILAFRCCKGFSKFLLRKGHRALSPAFHITLLCAFSLPARAHDRGDIHIHFGSSTVNGTASVIMGLLALLVGIAVYRQTYIYLVERDARRILA